MTRLPSICQLIYLSIFFLLILIQRITGFCPSACSCEGDYNLHTSCIKAGLEVVPIQLNPDVTYINLTHNQITSVHFTLSFYYKLEVLDISNNKVDTLGSRNFESQEKLRVLNLSKNAVANLSKDAFKGLKQLTILNLSDNKIELIHPTALQDLRNLIELDLTNNAIISLDNNILRHLVALEILSFRNNQFLEIPYEENLEYLRTLRDLDLSGNLIEYISNDSFVNLRSLNKLKLGGNVLMEMDVGAFDGLNALKYIDIADNNLTVVPTLQLSKLCNLTYLSLSGNSFVELPAVAFLNLFHLRELHLNRLDRLEKIDARAFVDNTYLQILSLDDNPSFADLPVRLFHGNPNLVDISIRKNMLVTLDAVQFPLDRLQRLRLADNPLVCNCSLLWLWRLATGYVHEDELVNGLMKSSNSTLIIDKDVIGCDLYEDDRRIHKLLRTMSESDIKCPAHLITIISAILSILLVIITGISVIYFVKFSKKRKKILQERRNVNERIVPQKVDKLELERYLAQQTLANEYRALRPWEVSIKDEVKYNNEINEPDHYENFDYFEHKRTLNKPHIVYV